MLVVDVVQVVRHLAGRARRRKWCHAAPACSTRTNESQPHGCQTKQADALVGIGRARDRRFSTCRIVPVQRWCRSRRGASAGAAKAVCRRHLGRSGWALPVELGARKRADRVDELLFDVGRLGPSAWQRRGVCDYLG